MTQSACALISSHLCPCTLTCIHMLTVCVPHPHSPRLCIPGKSLLCLGVRTPGLLCWHGGDLRAAAAVLVGGSGIGSVTAPACHAQSASCKSGTAHGALNARRLWGRRLRCRPDVRTLRLQCPAPWFSPTPIVLVLWFRAPQRCVSAHCHVSVQNFTENVKEVTVITDLIPGGTLRDSIIEAKALESAPRLSDYHCLFRSELGVMGSPGCIDLTSCNPVPGKPSAADRPAPRAWSADEAFTKDLAGHVATVRRHCMSHFTGGSSHQGPLHRGKGEQVRTRSPVSRRMRMHGANMRGANMRLHMRGWHRQHGGVVILQTP